MKRLLGFGAVAVLIFAAGVTINSVRESTWNGRGRFTVLTATPARIVSYNPSDGSLTIVPVGPLQIPSVGGYGSYLTDKLFLLDGIQKAGGGIVRGSVEQSFGVQILGVVQDDKIKIDFPLTVGSLLGQYLTGRLKTNMSFWESLRWIFAVGSVPRSEIVNADLAANALIKAENEPDGTVDLVLEQAKWDTWAKKYLYDPAVYAESLTVTVLNTSQEAGLGNRAARVIEDLGGNVVRVSDESRVDQGCIISGASSLKTSVTVAVISDVLKCRWEAADVSGERADLAVWVGDSYAKYLFGEASLNP